MYSAGDPGSGAGRGGGTGGSIRDAGGAFGKMEYAKEEQYFRALVSTGLPTIFFSAHALGIHSTVVTKKLR